MTFGEHVMVLQSHRKGDRPISGVFARSHSKVGFESYSRAVQCVYLEIMFPC